MPLGPAGKLGVDASALQRLQRRGLIEIRETMQGRSRRTQRVIAWKGTNAAGESAEKKSEESDNAETQRKRREERIRELLQTERGPLPLPQLMKLAEVTRAVIDRMLRDGLLESWEEPIDPAEDPFDVGYSPPAHELNAEQENALKAIRARFEFGEFGVHFEGVAVLHSALGDVERAREWWRVRNGEARVVVGTRSAVFAPLENVGLIIVDEEQENS